MSDRIISLGITCLVILFSFSACGKKESTAPVVLNQEYTIYMSSLVDFAASPIHEHFLFSFDPIKKVIIDSFFVKYPVNDIALSSDGSRLYFSRKGDVNYDWAIFSINPKTGDTLAQDIGFGGGAFSINSDESYAFVTDGQVVLYSLPDLTPVYTELKMTGSGAFLPGRDIACYSTGTEFTFLDYSNFPVIRTQKTLIGNNGDTLKASIILPSISGDSLIILARDLQYNQFLIISSSGSLEILKQYDIPIDLNLSADGVLHPDGTKAYFRYYGQIDFPGPPASPGKVYQLDLNTGELQEIFNGDAFGHESRIHIRKIELSPNQTELYIIGSGLYSGGFGSFVRLDLDTGEYVRAFFAENFSGMAINSGLRIE